MRNKEKTKTEAVREKEILSAPRRFPGGQGLIQPKVQEEAGTLAQFSSKNPNPLLCIAKDGVILYANSAASALLDHQEHIIGETVPDYWLGLVTGVFKSGVEKKVEVEHEGRVYSFAVVPVVESEYVNLYGSDITEHRKAEEEYRCIIQASLDGFWLLDSKGRFLDVNGAYCRLIGYSRDELLTMRVQDVEAKERPKETMKHISKVIETGYDRFETRHRCKDGRVVDIEVNAQYMGAGDGRFFVFLHDTTHRKKTEEALGKVYNELESEIIRRTSDLLETNKRLNQEILERQGIERHIRFSSSILKLFSRMSSRKEYLDAIVKLIHGLSGCRCVGIRVLNEENKIPYESYIGFSREFWESENWLSVIEDRCACIRVFTGKPLPQDTCVMTKGGSFRCDNTIKFVSELSEKEKAQFRGVCIGKGFTSIAIIPIRHRNKTIGAIHLADEKEAVVSLKSVEFIELLTHIIGGGIYKFGLADKIRKTNELLERIFTSTNFLIAYLDDNFNFIRVNQAYAQADGHTPDFYLGKNHFNLYPDEENEMIFRKVKETGEAYSVFAKPFVYAKNPERGITYWDWSLQPVKDASGKVEGLILCLVDVTNKKKAEEELIRTKEELINARRLSDIGALSATVAHELRNPLGVIRTAAYNIRRKSQDQNLYKHLDNIEKKIAESDQIINNLLSYTRIKMPHYEKIMIYAVLGECVISARKRFYGQKVSIRRRYRSIRNISIDADPYQIKEVFNNILNNAYQAVPERKGRIEITGVYDKKEGTVTINFKDNGTGISKEDLEKVFTPFFTTKSKGTGLGLTICSELVNLHAGKISIESEKDQGTFVTVILPSEKKAQ